MTEAVYRSAGGRLPVLKATWSTWLALASLIIASAAQAMDYSVDTTLKAQGRYDNNIRLQPEKGESVSGLEFIPEMTLRGASETTSISLDGTLWFRRFNRSGYDTNDQTLSGSFTHQFERQSVQVAAMLVRDSTLTSEILDSGRVTNANRHQQYLVAPSWTVFLGERDQLTLGGSYQQNKYNSESYTDYTYWQGGLTWTRIINERLKLFLQGNYSDYQTQPIDYSFQRYHTSSTDYGAQIGGSYILSEQLELSLLFGRSKDRTRYHTKLSDSQCVAHAFGFPVDLSDPLWRELLPTFYPMCFLDQRNSDAQMTTIDAGLTWNNERNQLSGHLLQQNQPSSNGYTIKQTQLTGGWTYRLWEGGALVTDLTVGRNRTPSGGNNSIMARQSNRTFGFASMAYRHTLSDNWSLSCRYQYRYQRYDELDIGSANGQVVYLSLSYQPRTRHWSR